MTKWVPEWAKSYKICPYRDESIIIVFSEWEVFDREEGSYNPIYKLTHDLSVYDVIQQIREKPLSSRIDVIGQNGNDGLHYDSVENPEHYKILPGVEVRDVRQALLSKIKDATSGQLDDWSRAWEYLTRMWSKGEKLQDAKKARKYLDWLIEELEQ